MGLWHDRAPIVQSMFDNNPNTTNADIAAYFHISKENARKRVGELVREGLVKRPEHKQSEPDLPKGAKQTLDRNEDGSYSSEKPLWMTLEQVKDDEYLLKAHGFEPDKWELVSAKHKIWNGYSKQDGIVTLYSSSITVKPKTSKWTFEQLVKAIQKVPKVTLPTIEGITRVKHMLEIPLYDMHWGVSTYEHYKPTRTEIYDLLSSKRWEQVLFVVGQCLFHHDNFRNTTASGTAIEQVSMPDAWKDCAMFYSILMEGALTRQSRRVKVVYAKGNHDESLAWCFVQYLKARYPQAEYDDSVRERKVHVFGSNFIGITHGDKARKD